MDVGTARRRPEISILKSRISNRHLQISNLNLRISNRKPHSMTWWSLFALLIAIGPVGCTNGGPFLRNNDPTEPSIMRGQIPAETTATRTHNPQAVKTLRKAVEQYRNGQMQPALKQVLSARFIDPTLVETYLWEVEIRFDLGDRKQYKRALVEALSATQQQASAQNSLGKRCLETDLEERGIAALGRAVRLDRKNSDYAHDMAAALIELGFTDEARDVFKDAMLRMPTVTSLQLSAASLEEKHEQWAAAAKLYDVAMKHNPSNLSARRHRARCLYQIGEYGRAAHDYEICLGRKDRSISMNDYVQLGDSLLRSGDAVRAQTVFDRMSQRLPVPSKEVELLRAISRLKTDAKDEARVIINESLARWPNDRQLQSAKQLCDGEVAAQLVGHALPALSVDTLIEARKR